MRRTNYGTFTESDEPTENEKAIAEIVQIAESVGLVVEENKTALNLQFMLDIMHGIQRQTAANIKAEIESTLYVDSLIFDELFDFKDGKISEDDVIEEFNRVTKLEVLQIIDKCGKGKA